jgi:hypothetical protein
VTTSQDAPVAVRESEPADGAFDLVDWSMFGRVLPILAASPGAGATIAAVAIADALQLAGLSVLLIDAGDPVRSGLARASRADGPRREVPHSGTGIRFSWRARALLVRLEVLQGAADAPVFPSPPSWHPGGRRADVTVVDIGHDPWRMFSDPSAGPGQWLRPGSPSPIPALVVRPTVPGLAHAEQILARLEPFVRDGGVTPPTQLIVMGARRWPPAVPGTAGRRTSVLLPDTVFFPAHPTTAVNGVTAEVTAAPLVSAASALLRALRVLPAKPHAWTRRLRPSTHHREPDRDVPVAD